jgi:FixJ family two-component response regulator
MHVVVLAEECAMIQTDTPLSRTGTVRERAGASQYKHSSRTRCPGADRLGTCDQPRPSIVFVVNDDPGMRASLEPVIRRAGWQVKAFRDAGTFLSQPRERAPNCLILNVDLPDSSGLEVQALLADRPDLPIIFATDRADLRTTVRAMKAGAVEFLEMPFDENELLNAIQHAMLRSRAELAHEAGLSVLQSRYASLSAREREVMALVIAGKLNKLIAAALGISEITVKAHRGKVMRKMQAASVPDLVRMSTQLTAST